MTYGLKVWGPTGNVRLDTSDRLPRFHAVYPVSVNYFSVSSGFVAVSGMVDDGTWIVFAASTEIWIDIVAGGFNWYPLYPLTIATTVNVCVMRA